VDVATYNTKAAAQEVFEAAAPTRGTKAYLVLQKERQKVEKAEKAAVMEKRKSVRKQRKSVGANLCT